MKKFFSFIIATMMFATCAFAQHVEESKLFDNVSITVKGGVTTPLQTPVEDFRGIVGLELEKMITPVFGLGVEGEWTVNTSKWTGDPGSYWFDHQYVGVFTTINWMNLLNGYKQRTFEVESVLGVGWGHAYTDWSDPNYIVTKAGLNFKFNVNDALTLSLKPAVIWNMNSGYNSNYNIDRGALQIQAGVTYHFEGPSGYRYFVVCDKVATQSEIDALNRTINGLREQNQRDRDNHAKQLNDLIETNKQLSKALEECEKREVVVNNTMVAPIQFKQGSDKLVNSDAAIKSIADMIIAGGEKYMVIGYASEEGNEDYNKELSFDRAVAVADALVEYGVKPEQLITEGVGETTEFGEEPELNRIVIVKK